MSVIDGNRGFENHTPTVKRMARLLTFLKEEPSADVLTLFLMSAAQKTEHYEMIGYRGLIGMAKALSEKKVAGLLSETLKEEEAMALELEQLEKKHSKRLIATAG